MALIGSDLRSLRLLRDKIQKYEGELDDLRQRRNRIAVKLASAGFPERVVGEHAGVSGPYVNNLKRRKELANDSSLRQG